MSKKHSTVIVKITGIQWDTDGQEVDLPSEMNVQVEREDTDDEIFDAAIDEASNQTGWCIKEIGDIETLN